MTFPLVSRKINKVFIHCSASDNPAHDDVSVMDKWHRARGYSGCGYHFFIKKDGTIQNGREIDRVPAAQAPHNKGSLAICLHGLDKDKFTNAQFESLRRLCSAINHAYDVTFHGHCEVSNKLCPVFDYIQVLSLAGNGRMEKNSCYGGIYEMA